MKKHEGPKDQKEYEEFIKLMEKKEYLLKFSGSEYLLLTEMVNFALCHEDFKKRFENDPVRVYLLEQMGKLYSRLCWGVNGKKVEEPK